MFEVLQWFLFGMFVWACCIVMSAFSRRVAPELESELGMDDGMMNQSSPTSSRSRRDKDAEIAALKARIETLEAIVTDPKYRWDQEFSQQTEPTRS